MSNERHPEPRFARGDRVRVDIPDETHPKHARYHGKHGHVIAAIAGSRRTTAGETERDGLLRVEFDSGGYADFERYLLRPPITE